MSEERGRVLKASASRRVVAGAWRGRAVVVKERRRRGWRRWGAAGVVFLTWRVRRLRRRGVRVPWLHGVRVSSLGGRTAVIAERVAGPTLAAFLAATPPGAAARRTVARRLGRLLGRLHRAGYRCRDLKAPNVVLDGRLRPWLVDLDGVRRLWGGRRTALRRDLARLRRDLRAAGGATLGETRAFLRAWRRASGGA